MDGPTQAFFVHEPSGCCHEETPVYLAAWQHGRRRVDRRGERASDPDTAVAAARRSRSSRRSRVEFETFAEGLDHPEGAAVGPDGTVYAGGEAGQIYRIGRDGTPEAYADTGGFLYRRDGRRRAATSTAATWAAARSCGSIRPARSRRTRAGPHEHPLRVPNFSAFDDAGNLYVTDSGEWGADDGFAVPGRARRRDDDVERRGHGVPERVLPDRGGRRAARGRVAHPPRRAGADRWTTGARRARSSSPTSPGASPTGSRSPPTARCSSAATGPTACGGSRPDGAPEIWFEDPDGVVLNQPANPVFVGAGLGSVAAVRASAAGTW